MEKERTLQLLVEKEWTLETINSLGSGFLYHLAYPVELIQPALVTAIRSGVVGEGHNLEILHYYDHTLRRIAVGEVVKINDFQTFMRIDFRLLQTAPSLRGYPEATDNGYRFLFRE
ncbi:MAG TPA: hypothetical protein GXZ36_05970 [Firmicutes bacterium]|nr:hypothetical protein [Bacillota bacterium]